MSDITDISVMTGKFKYKHDIVEYEVIKMTDEISSSGNGKYGLWTSLLGALIILIDGIAVLAANTLYGWSATGVTGTGWTEIILSLIMMGVTYYYNKSPKGAGWTIVILALITLPFDGGFWTIGAWIALIGGLLIAYEK